MSPLVVVSEMDLVASGVEPVKSISLLFVRLSVLVTLAEFGDRCRALVDVLLRYALVAATDNVSATVFTAAVEELDLCILPPAVSDVVDP